MYINPFVAGIICTIGIEILLIIAWAVISTINDKLKKGKK